MKAKKGLLFLLFISCGAVKDNSEITIEQLNKAERVLFFLNKSQNLLRAGQYNSALVFVDSAKSYAPNLPEVFFLKGLILDETNQFQESETAYRRVLSLDPGYKGAWFNLGNNALLLREFNSALQYYKNELKDNQTAAVYEKIAITYANIYEQELAENNAIEAIKLDSLYAPAHILLGRIYRDEGKVEKGLSFFRSAVSFDQKNPEYQYELGSLLLTAGMVDESVPYLFSASKQMPWHYGTHYNLGQALLHVGKKDEAEIFFSRADSLRDLENLSARLLLRTRANPQDQAGWGNLGNTYREMGRLNDANKAYKIALSLGPADVQLENTVAYLSLLTGDTTGAIFYYEHILQQNPSRTDTWFNLGLIQASKGMYGAARRSWENVLTLDPSDTTAIKFIEAIPEPNFFELIQ